MSSGVLTPFGEAGFTAPGGGGLGASTMPLAGGVVLGVGMVSIGTEFVTGNVDAVGEVLLGLPFTLLAGCGMLGGTEPSFGVNARTAAGGRAPTGCVIVDGRFGGCASLSSSLSKLGALGLGGETPPLCGVRISSSGVFEAVCRSTMLVPVPSISVSRMSATGAGP